MQIRFMRAAGILSAATVALSLGACSSSSGGGGGGGGGGGDEFSVQTWSEVAPNTFLATFLAAIIHERRMI